MASEVAQYGTKVVRPYIDMRPTLTVDAGEECVAIVQKPISLPEYRARR